MCRETERKTQVEYSSSVVLFENMLQPLCFLQFVCICIIIVHCFVLLYSWIQNQTLKEDCAV